MAVSQEHCEGHSQVQLKLWVSQRVGGGDEQPCAEHESQHGWEAQAKLE